MPTLSRRSTLALLLALPLSACHFGYVAPNPNDPLRGVRNFVIEPLAYHGSERSLMNPEARVKLNGAQIGKVEVG